MHNQPVDASLAREFQSATLILASVSKEQGVPSRPLVGSALGGETTSVAVPVKATASRQGLSPQGNSGAHSHVWEEVERSDSQAGFLSRYFLMPKKDGGLPPILDLRGLNKYLCALRSRFFTVPRVRQTIKAGDWFVTIDLKDAYFQIPIWPGHWRFLRFAFEGRIFEFQVLPFGLSLAPLTFTRCMDAVLAPLRQQGLSILNYLDDWLICANSEELCRQHVALLLTHIQCLGLCLNTKKSKLQPCRVTNSLGMVLDFRRLLLPSLQRDSSPLLPVSVPSPSGLRGTGGFASDSWALWQQWYR